MIRFPLFLGIEVYRSKLIVLENARDIYPVTLKIMKVHKCDQKTEIMIWKWIDFSLFNLIVLY